MAIIGERSSQAEPTPVARLVAPGPRVAIARPGAPIRRPLTSAAKPAEPSWAVSTNATPPLRMASIRGSTFPLGMPKPWRMPAALRLATIRSALFMGGLNGFLAIQGCFWHHTTRISLDRRHGGAYKHAQRNGDCGTKCAIKLLS